MVIPPDGAGAGAVRPAQALGAGRAGDRAAGAGGGDDAALRHGGGVSAMAKPETSWQRVSANPVFAAIMLVVTLGGVWAVASATADRLFCFLAQACG